MAFWVDETVKEIISERKDKKYLVTDYKTPSGRVHVGALRGVIIHDVIYKGLQDLKKKTDYWYGFDDFDPMDDLPDNLKNKFSKYMGMPLCNIPAPTPAGAVRRSISDKTRMDNSMWHAESEGGRAKNYAEYFAQEFIKVFNSLNARPKIVWASEFYRSGKYDQAIKLVLDNATRIRDIYKEVSGSVKPKDWYGLQVVCPKCGKIGTTRVYDWDKKEVSFVCEENLVKWAKGCGYKGKLSPFGGKAKMPYKIETAAKWFTFDTSVELAGKDHYTKGGTFDVARKIAQDVFKIKPAYGYGYEWFLTSGKKMSSSRGVGVSAKEISEAVPAELLRFLMVRTRAKRTIDFDIFGETVPLLYDEFDRCIDEYFKDPKTDFARAYYYSMKEARPPSYRLRFSKIVYLLQMQRTDIYKYAEEENGKKLNEAELKELKIRAEYAEKWLKNYAPDNYKFTIQQKLPAVAKKLNKIQKDFLAEIVELLEKKKWRGEDLHQEIHEIKKRTGINPREAFSAIYLSILGKDSGPQAGWLLASLDRKFVIKRFKEI